jgi:prepilin-type N-terminal cleavage/methylation domain-containing protein
MSHRLYRGDSERGMTMIELMVALVVFAIASTAIVAGLISTMQSTRTSRNRLQASSLAAREMEILRNEFRSSAATALAVGSANVTNPHPLPGGTAGADLTIDGSPYTVVRNVEWLPAGTGQSACDGGATLSYPSLAVNVSVTWPRMGGNIKPVVSNTVLTPPKNTLAVGTSFVGVRVLDVAAGKVAGQTVNLTGPGGTFSDTTAVDGCAVFALTVPGTYTASLNPASGYVDTTWNPNPTQTATVGTATLTQVSFSYDKAATLPVQLTTLSGYALPQTLPQISFYNTGLPLGVKIVPATGAVTTVGNLWPFNDGYALWAGSCRQSDPLVAGSTRDPSVVLAAGVTAPTTNVRLAPVQVNVTFASGGAVAPLATVTATPVDNTNCAGTDLAPALTLGVTDSVTGILKTSLPVGKWNLKAVLLTKSGTKTTTPLLQSSPASTYAIAVS